MTNDNIKKFPSMIATDEDFTRAFDDTMMWYSGEHPNEIAGALGYFEQAVRDKVSHRKLLENLIKTIADNN